MTSAMSSFGCPRCGSVMTKPGMGKIAMCPVCGVKIKKKDKPAKLYPVRTATPVRKKEEKKEMINVVARKKEGMKAEERKREVKKAVAVQKTGPAQPAERKPPIRVPKPETEVKLPKEGGATLLRTFIWMAVICSLVFLLANFIALLFACGTIGEALETGNGDLDLFVATPFVASLVSLTGAGLEAWFVLLVTAVFVSYMLMFRKWGWDLLGQLRSPTPAWTGETQGPAGKRRWFLPITAQDNGIVMVLMLFMATTFFSYYIAYVLQAFAVERSAPPFSEWPDWYVLLKLLNASVWEEVADRVILIGIPLLLVRRFVRREVMPWYKYLTGGEIRSDMDSHFIVFVSALFFGFSHVGGWDAWRFLDTFVGGLVLAYLFMRFGLQASILMHFLIDYNFRILYVPGMTGLEVPFLFMWIITLVAGGILFVIFTWKLLHGVWQDLGRLRRDRRFTRSIYPYTDLRRIWKPVPARVGKIVVVIIALMLVLPMMTAGLAALGREPRNLWLENRRPTGDEPVYEIINIGETRRHSLTEFDVKRGDRVTMIITESTGQDFDVYVEGMDWVTSTNQDAVQTFVTVEGVRGFFVTTYYWEHDGDVELVIDHSESVGVDPYQSDSPAPLDVNITIYGWSANPLNVPVCGFGIGMFIIITFLAGFIALRRSRRRGRVQALSRRQDTRPGADIRELLDLPSQKAGAALTAVSPVPKEGPPGPEEDGIPEFEEFSDEEELDRAVADVNVKPEMPVAVARPVEKDGGKDAEDDLDDDRIEDLIYGFGARIKKRE